jgi:transposase
MRHNEELRFAKRVAAATLLDVGKSVGMVAKYTRQSKRTVYRIQSRATKTLSFRDRPRPGRPRKVTGNKMRLVKRLWREGNVRSVRTLQTRLRGMNINLSTGSIVNLLHGAGLRSVRPVPRPKLEPRHIAARLAYARTLVNNKEEEHKRTVYSDEKLFRLGSTAKNLWIQVEDPIAVVPTGKPQYIHPHLPLFHPPPHSYNFLAHFFLL